MKVQVLRRVDRVDQSPLNARRWCLTLTPCGHEVWVTANRRPFTTMVACPRCLEHARSGGKGS